MSRYVERAEHAARLLDVNLTLMLDEDAEDTGRRWKRLLAALAAPEGPSALPSRPKPAGALEPRELLRQLVFDRESQHSIMWTLGLARDNARQVRAQLPSEMWEQINRLHLQLGQDSIEDAWRAQPHDYFRATREGLHLWDGITFATMRRDEGWDWLQAGRFVERAGQTAALLEAYAGELQPGERPITTRDELDWVGLLKSRTAFEAYCQVYTADVRPDWIVAFLMFNEDFPQSARFAAGRVYAALESIADVAGARDHAKLERLAGRLRARLDYGTADEALAGDFAGFLRDLRLQLEQLHNLIVRVYFQPPSEAVL